MDGLWREVVVGLRQYRRSPGLAASVAVTIGLGVGANLAVFALARDAILPSSPYRNTESLTIVENTGPYMPEGGGPDGFASAEISGPDLVDLEARQRSFSSLGVFTDLRISVLSGTDRPRSVCRIFVSETLFDVLGVAPTMGRLLTHGDFAADAPGAAVATDGLWRSLFGSSPAVVGRAVRLDEQPFAVVGVVPASAFTLLARRSGLFDSGAFERCLVTPLVKGRLGESERTFTYWREHRDSPSVRVIGLRRPGVTPEAAQADVAGIGRALGAAYPATNRTRGLTAVPLQRWRAAEIQPLLLMLAVAAGLAFLVACANAAGLVLAESVRSEPELALRQALGASTLQLLRVGLVRAVLWALPGAGFGFVFGTAILAFVRWGASAVDDRIGVVSIGLPVLAAGLGLTLLAGLVTGLASAWSIRRTGLTDALRDAGQTTSTGGVRRHASLVLVGLQIAVATALAIGAGLLVRSMWNVVSMDRGFDLDRGFVMMVRLPRSDYQTSLQQGRFYQQALARIRALPGVAAAGVSASPPLAGTSVALAGDIEVTTPAASHSLDRLAGQFVTPGYFDAVRLRLLRGRVFTLQDEQADAPVIVVDDTFRQRHIGTADPLASTLKFGRSLLSIVGVVADVRQATGTERTPRRQTGTVYMLFRRFSRPPVWSFLVVRATDNPVTLAEAAVREVMAVDATACLDEPRTFARMLAARIAERRRILGLLGSFAAIVLVLTASSLTGALAQYVAGHTREIAIRVAIGATRPHIVRLTARQVGLSLVAGLAAGSGGGLWIARALRAQLFELQPGDPTTIVAAVLVLLVVACVSVAGPVWRACRVEGVAALRAI